MKKLADAEKIGLEKLTRHGEKKKLRGKLGCDVIATVITNDENPRENHDEAPILRGLYTYGFTALFFHLPRLSYHVFRFAPPSLG